jgi:hypothetical protein
MAVPVTEAAQAAENFKFKPELNCVTVTEYNIQFRPSLYTRYWYNISKFLFDIGFDIVLQYRDITISKVKTLMSYMTSEQCWRYRRFFNIVLV